MPDAISDAQSLESGNYTQHYLLQQLHVAASGSKAAFCCSGSVPITGESPFEKIKNNLEGSQLSSHAVIIRWDEKDGESCSKVTLPPKTYQESAKDQLALANLLHACTPASFGKDGKDVLDETYRKAAKLDSYQFSTNFSPYDVGIIATVTQILLPGIAKPLARRKLLSVENLGVVAELYNLDVWLSPPPTCHVLHTVFGSGVFCTVRHVQAARRHPSWSQSIWIPRRLSTLSSSGRGLAHQSGPRVPQPGNDLRLGRSRFDDSMGCLLQRL